MPDFLIRKIDPALWARVKARAEKQDLPLRTVVLQLLRAYAKGDVTIAATSTEN